MADETPASPKRSKKRDHDAPADADLVGVMAGTSPAAPDEGLVVDQEGAPDPMAAAELEAEAEARAETPAEIPTVPPAVPPAVLPGEFVLEIRLTEADDDAPAKEPIPVMAPPADRESGRRDPDPQPEAAPAPAPAPAVETEPRPSAALASLRMERGGIAEATADTVDVRMGGIGRLTADDVYVQWGGVGAARAQKVSVEMGSVGAALAGDLSVSQGFAGSVIAREAVVEQGVVRTLIAGHVTITRPSAVLVLIAGRVTGEVRPLMDWRAALAAGAGFALVAALLARLRAGR
jgi:hypothetical protein